MTMTLTILFRPIVKDSEPTLVGLSSGGANHADVIAAIPRPQSRKESSFVRSAQHRPFQGCVTDYALFLKANRLIQGPDFVVTPEMREEVWKRMKARGVDCTSHRLRRCRAALVSRMLGFEIARYVFGSEAEFRRRAFG